MISEFVENEVARLEEAQNEYVNNPAPVEVLDDLFRQELAEVWRTGNH